MHEENGKPQRGALQNLCALALEAFRTCIVPHPDFKQIAQHKDCIGPRDAHVALPGTECQNIRFLQVHVGNEINRSPVRRGQQHARCALYLKRDGFLNHHIVIGNIVVMALATGLDGLDFVNDVGTANHFAKHCIAPALG